MSALSPKFLGCGFHCANLSQQTLSSHSPHIFAQVVNVPAYLWSSGIILNLCITHSVYAAVLHGLFGIFIADSVENVVPTSPYYSFICW